MDPDREFAALAVAGVSCAVPGRTLFSDLSFSVGAGESVALMGPSGVGKSTLLAAILGIRPIEAGAISVAGERIDLASPQRRAQIRRERIGMVFQDGELLDELTAAENVAIAAMLATPDARRSLDAARALLETLGVPPDTETSSLSGGERQRTALARALITKPILLLADEPTASLDAQTKVRAAAELFDAPRTRGCALVVATHDGDIASLADRVITLAAVPAASVG